MVVPVAELNALMQFQQEAVTLSGTALPLGASPSWNTDVKLPLDVALALLMNLPLQLDTVPSRKNDKSVLRAKIMTAVEKIRNDATEKGIPFDTAEIPGRKVDFIRILSTIDPSISRAPSTFSDHFSELGFRWRQGGRERDAAELLALYDLALDQAAELGANSA
jgi:hypothetical protein